MSALVYGALVRRKREQSEADSVAGDQTENKLVTAIAALVPVEVIAGHALVLSKTTTTDAAGNTTITDSGALGGSLIILLVLSVVAFLITRGFANWEQKDYVRALLPALSFLAWTAIIGTSALTPWVVGRLDGAQVVVAGVTLAIVLIAINTRVNPPTPA